MERKYTIDHCRDFQTGRLPDGRQMLIGLMHKVLAGVVFSMDGDYLETLEREIECQAPMNQTYFDLDDEPIQPDIEAWKFELGWVSQPISVKRFKADNPGVMIEDYPSHFEDLGDPSFPADRRLELAEFKARWEREGMFVLWWGKDYWMARDGSVDST